MAVVLALMAAHLRASLPTFASGKLDFERR
jgi:hypothetical protein